MSIKERKDGWNSSDDSLLTETVLRHIRTGSSQLNAFDEVSERLNRSPAACGFRWNATVRKLHEAEIREAKASKLKSLPKKVKVTSADDPYSTLDMKELIKLVNDLITTINNKDNVIENLKHQLSDMGKVDASMNEDYNTLMKIFEHARQIGAINGGNEQTS